MHWLKHVDFPGPFMRCGLCWLGLLVCISTFAQTSILSVGNWHKLAINKTGIYRIDAPLLRKMGVEPATINPRQIQIFGHKGGMLPQANNALQSNALQESAIWISGGEDGKFDEADAIYCYAESPHAISIDAVKAELKHQINIYSDSSYYFLTFGQKDGLRIQAQETSSSANAKVVTQFDDYWFHEEESHNLLKSGREWWGEYLSNSPLSIAAQLPGIVPASTIKVRTSAIGAAQVPTKFIWQLNGKQIGESAIGTVSTGTYDVKALRSDVTFEVNAEHALPETLQMSVTYDRGGQSSAQAYLNFIALQVKRSLRAYEGQQLYRFLPETVDTVMYQFSNVVPDWILWNVSDAARPTLVSPDVQNNVLTFTKRGAKEGMQFVGFRTSDAIAPDYLGKVKNQDIRKSQTPDLLIVTPAVWKSEAERLARFRETNDGLTTLVVTTEEVYNEFAAGKPDLTAIRDFTKYLYNKTPGKLKYLLLFGDASFDYKNLLKNQSDAQRNAWVPVYESRESLNPVYTYSSDDYFGFLESGEGNWEESASGDATVDIGIGRLPVKTLDEATVIVDKLIRYGSSIKSLGSWRNTIHFVADDGDGNIHQRHADELATLTQTQFKSSRIFIDAFPQTTGAEGQKTPAINRAISKAIDNGTLILNYTGHGGVSGWAEEQVLTLADMRAARGMDNLPLLFTATCDFGRYDDPALVSGAEIMVLSPRGAAIGAISTTRPVYSSTNFTLSKAFYEALTNKHANRSLGDLFIETKNKALVGSLNRNFTLLADPSMKLAKAQKGIRWSQKPDTLRALQKVVLKGEVFDFGKTKKDSLFNGVVRLELFDKKTIFKTLGNEGDAENYLEYRSKLFDGRVKVIAGKFSCEFVMPKDIDYRTGVGRANIYAIAEDSVSDASAQLDVMIGGSAVPGTDVTPPAMSVYMNDASFRNGDVLEPSPIMFVKVNDENGISISSAGIGHHMTMVINDTLTIVLNDYYTADLDDYRKGVITFPFENLPAGKYVIRLKVWDTYTNFSEIAFDFQIGALKGIQLNTLNVYPNPFDKDLSFELSHNRINEDIEVVLNIFLNNGKSLGTLRRQYFNSEPMIKESFNAMQIGNWIPRLTSLVYQFTIRSLKDNSTDQRSGKLVRSP